MYLRLTWRGELLHSLSLRFVDAFGASSDTQRSDPCSMWPFLVRLQSWLPPAPWQDGALMEPRWILDKTQLAWIVSLKWALQHLFTFWNIMILDCNSNCLALYSVLFFFSTMNLDWHTTTTNGGTQGMVVLGTIIGWILPSAAQITTKLQW